MLKSHSKIVKKSATNLDEIVFGSLVEMGNLVRAKKISPAELVDAHIARIERANPQLNAFVHMAFDQARAEARGANRARVLSGVSAE